jgi:hypothetical protein
MLPESIEKYRQEVLQSRYKEILDYERRRLLQDKKTPWPQYTSPLSDYDFLTSDFGDPSFEQLIINRSNELDRRLKILLPFSPCLEFKTSHIRYINEAVGITAIDFGEEYYSTLVNNGRLPDFRKIIAGDIHSPHFWERVPFNFDMIIQVPGGAFADSLFCGPYLYDDEMLDKDHLLSMYTYFNLFKSTYAHLSNESGLLYSQFPQLSLDEIIKMKLIKNFIRILNDNEIIASHSRDVLYNIKLQKTPKSPKTLDKINFAQTIPQEILNILKCPDCPIMEGCRLKSTRSVQEITKIARAKNTGATQVNVTSRLAGIVGDSVRNRTTVTFNSDGSIASAICHREGEPENIRGRL